MTDDFTARPIPIHFTDLCGEQIANRLPGTESIATTRREIDIDLSQIVAMDAFATAQLCGFVDAAARRGHAVTVRLPLIGPTPVERERLERTPANANLATQQALERQTVGARSKARRDLDARGFTEAFRCRHLPATLQPKVVTRGVRSDGSLTHMVEVRVQPQPEDVLPFKWFKVDEESDVEVVSAQLWTPLSQHDVPTAVQDMIRELVKNVWEHTFWYEADEERSALETKPHGLFGAVIGPPHGLSLIAVDGGRGIPDTLRAEFRRQNPPVTAGEDHQIIEWAFTDRGSRKILEDRDSSGLGHVRRLVSGYQGAINVVSNGGLLKYRGGEWKHPKVNRTPKFGNSIEVSCQRSQLEPFGRRVSGGESSNQVVELRKLVETENDETLPKPAGDPTALVLICPDWTDRDLLISRVQETAAEGMPLLILAPHDRWLSTLSVLQPARDVGKFPEGSEIYLMDLGGLTHVGEAIEPEVQREGRLWAAARKAIDSACERSVIEIVRDNDGEPTLTWSMGVVSDFIDIKRLEPSPVYREMMAWSIANRIREDFGDDVEEELVILEPELFRLAVSTGAWLGIERSGIVTLRSAFEPDPARFLRERPGYTHVLTAILNQGAAVYPTVSGLRKAGQSLGRLVALVNGRDPESGPLVVNGEQVAIAAFLERSFGADSADVEVTRNSALERLKSRHSALKSDRFVSQVAATPGALKLGHFHSDNRSWTSCMVDPRYTTSATSPIGVTVIEQMTTFLKATFPSSDTMRFRGCKKGGHPAQALAESLQARAESEGFSIAGPEDGSPAVDVVVDWGAITGSAMLDEARRLIDDGSREIVLLVGVDRRYIGSHTLLTSDFTVEVGGTARVRRYSAGWLPFDPRISVGCPLCKVQHDLAVTQPVLSQDRAQERSEWLQVRGPYEEGRIQTQDSFGDVLGVSESASFLVMRQLLLEALDDKLLAYGLLQQLHSHSEEGKSPSLFSLNELDAVCRVFLLSPELIKRRPFTSPAFRNRLAALAEVMLFKSPLSPGQWATLLRISSKPDFLRVVRQNFEKLDIDAQSDVLAAVATLLLRSYHHAGRVSEETRAVVRSFANSQLTEAIRSQVAELQRLSVQSTQRELQQSLRSPIEFWEHMHDVLAKNLSHVTISGARSTLHAFFNSLQSQATELQYSALEHQAAVERPAWQAFRDFLLEELGPAVEAAIDSFDAGGVGGTRAFMKAEVYEQVSVVDEFFATVCGGGPELDQTALARAERNGQALLDIADPIQSYLLQSCMSVPANVSRELREFEQVVASEAAVAVVAGGGPDVFALIHRDSLRMLLTQLVSNARKHATSPTPKVTFEVSTADDGAAVFLDALSSGTLRSARRPFVDGGLSAEQFGGLVKRLGGRVEELEDLGAQYSFGVRVVLVGRSPRPDLFRHALEALGQ